MKYIMIAVFFLYNIGFAIANDKGNDNMIRGNVDVLENHLKEDNRLLDANEHIHFIEAMKHESIDENTSMTFPDISSDKLILSNNLQFMVSSSPSNRKMDSNNQLVSVSKAFNLVSLSDDKKRFSLYIDEYFGNDRYYKARNDFLYGIRASTMPTIPFIRWPENLGTISIATTSTSNRTIRWFYHNLYFDTKSLGLSEDEQLAVVYWVQQQVVKVNL